MTSASQQHPDEGALPADVAPAPGPQGATATGAGARLQVARRAQGLSLGDIARQLKLSVKQVEALEHDDYSMFPGPVFVRGFLRNYAKLLGLEPSAVLPPAAVPQATGEALAMAAGGLEQVEPRAWAGMRSLVAVLCGALLAAGLVVLAKRGGREEHPAPALRGPLVVSPAAPASGPQRLAPIPNTLPAQPRALGNEAQSAHPGVDLLTGRAMAPPTASGYTASSAEEPGASLAVREVAMTPSGEPIRMVFDDESWVEIRDASGEVVFSRLNEPGSTRVVRGAPPFTVVIGNARAVQLYFQDKQIDLAPHTRIDVARVVLE